jgi:biopolymer transport protein ExbD
VNRSRSHRQRHKEVQELNITAFMNLMVVLTPFLLITAVFSRMAILELNLPSADAVAQAEEPEFSLEIIVRADNIAVGDRNAGVLTTLPKIDGGYDIDGLNDYLKRVKANFPDQFAATLLLEPQVDYDVLVQVMDAVRSYTVEDSNSFQRAELFPEISVGDAPLLARGD